VVQEVVPTAEELTPPEPLLAPEDARGVYVRNAAVMSAGTALSRLTGFLRLTVQTAVLGVTISALGNTYTVANTTPNIVYELILGGILTSVFVPVFVEHLRLRGRQEAWDVARRVLTIALVVLTAVVILAEIFAEQIIRLYLISSDALDREAQIELGTFLLRWFLPQIVFYGIGAVATGLLNAERKFAAPMFAPILNNLVAVITFIAYAVLRGSNPPSVEAITLPQATILGAGTTLGVVAMTAALWPSLRGLGFRWRTRWDWNHPAVRRLARLSLWVIVYVAANQLAYLVIIVLANGFRAGTQIYASAFIILLLPHSLFAVSIYTALLPGMSQQWTAGNEAGVRELLSRGIRDTAVVTIPAAIGYLVIGLPIVQVLLEHGEAGPQDAELIARTLQAFAIGLPFFSAFQLITRTFYAMQDSKTPALVNVAAAVLNVAVDALFVFGVGTGVAGLALGHAISYIAATIFGMAVLRARLHGIDGPRIRSTLLRVIPAGIGAGLAAHLATLPFPDANQRLGAELLEVTAAVMVGILAYLGLALIFHVQEVDEVKSALRRRIAR
jgi:putative peptidoglycan lipid II flippase